MPYSSKTIANAFLELAESQNQQLTNMQVQKLVYFAHGWQLVLKKEPLITDSVKAWTFGPVIPPLYNSLKKYGNGVVSEKISSAPDEKIDDSSKSLVGKIWEVYGQLTGGRMSAITHSNDSAWSQVYKKEPFSVIDNSLIEKEFENFNR